MKLYATPDIQPPWLPTTTCRPLCLQHMGPSTIRGLARELERDVKRVHDDVTTLMEWGIVQRDNDGLVHVPYSVIHAAFDLKAVA